MSWSAEERKRLFEDELLPLFQTLIRNACVNDGRPESGQEVKSADTLEAYLKQAGLDCQRWEPMPGRVSLQTEVAAQPGAPTLTLMGHTDVVPARSEDWSHPPFAAEIHEGQVWGRGTVDMLCWTAAQAVATAAHASKKEVVRKWNLRFLALADEEASGSFGARYLTEHHWDKVRCDAMVTELGGFFIHGKNGPAAVFTVAEKGVCWLKAAWKGKAAHGSMPYGSDNALLKASRAALLLAAWQSPIDDSDLLHGMEGAMRQGNNSDVLDELPRGAAAFLHTAGRTTISPNILRTGEKTNIIPDRAELFLDIRFLEKDCPERTPESVKNLIRSILGKELGDACTLDVIDYFPPNENPLEGPVPSATAALLNQAEPGAKLMPTRIGGVTDGRYWRSRGVPVYGFTLFAKDMGLDDYSSRIHAADERISLASLARCLDYFLDLPLHL